MRSIVLGLPLKLVFSGPSNQTLDRVFNSRGLYYKNFIAVINYDSSKLQCLSVSVTSTLVYFWQTQLGPT
jgi:hypothetical protein